MYCGIRPIRSKITSSQPNVCSLPFSVYVRRYNKTNNSYKHVDSIHALRVHVHSSMCLWVLRISFMFSFVFVFVLPIHFVYTDQMSERLCMQNHKSAFLFSPNPSTHHKFCIYDQTVFIHMRFSMAYISTEYRHKVKNFISRFLFVLSTKYGYTKWISKWTGIQLTIDEFVERKINCYVAYKWTLNENW